jgi:hypothetical protein
VLGREELAALFDIGEVFFDGTGVGRMETGKARHAQSWWKAAVSRMMSDGQGRTGNRCSRTQWFNQSALVVVRTARGDEPLAAFGCDQPGAGALVA